MNTTQILITIALMAIVTFLLRAMPFLFRDMIEKNDFFLFIKDKLPTMMMFILVFYATGFQRFDPIDSYYQPVIALGLTVLVHAVFRHFLLSITTGTICYILLTTL